MPGFWYEAHLRGGDDGYHVAGATVPGVPMVLNGHNQHCCWAQTLTYAQMEDVFLERCTCVPAEGRVAGGGMTYEHLGITKEAVHRVETIKVKVCSPVLWRVDT
jgi:penicillin amidase